MTNQYDDDVTGHFLTLVLVFGVFGEVIEIDLNCAYSVFCYQTKQMSERKFNINRNGLFHFHSALGMILTCCWLRLYQLFCRLLRSED